MKPKTRHAAVQTNNTVLNPLNIPPISKDTAASMSAAPNEPEETVQIIKCEHCDFKAETTQHMKVHVNLKHKVLKCDYCEYKNHSMDILKEHMQKKHKNHHTRSLPRRHRNYSPPHSFGC